MVVCVVRVAYINADADYQREGIHIQFGTLSDYFEAVKAEDVAHPYYDGDFFPYADNEDSYWTVSVHTRGKRDRCLTDCASTQGYYTTRPLLKQQSRTTESILRSAEFIHSFARVSQRSSSVEPGLWAESFDAMEFARRQTALVQHHDGITGMLCAF